MNFMKEGNKHNQSSQAKMPVGVMAPDRDWTHNSQDSEGVLWIMLSVRVVKETGDHKY